MSHHKEGKPGHFEKDCWAKSPKRTDKDKGKGKDKAKGKEKGNGKSQSPHRDGKGMDKGETERSNSTVAESEEMLEMGLIVSDESPFFDMTVDKDV